jgi:hypothetical protein
MPSDVAKWLVALPDARFRDIVASDCAATLDDEASQALRETIVLGRWLKALDAMISLSPPTGTSGRQLTERRAEAARLLATRARDPGGYAEERQAGGTAMRIARKAAQQQAGRAGTSNGARRRAAGAVAVERLIAAHRDEFAQLLVAAHEELDTPEEDVIRARRLVRAGLTWRAAEDFTARKWPDGDLSDGVRLVVTDDGNP